MTNLATWHVGSLANNLKGFINTISAITSEDYLNSEVRIASEDAYTTTGKTVRETLDAFEKICRTTLSAGKITPDQWVATGIIGQELDTISAMRGIVKDFKQYISEEKLGIYVKGSYIAVLNLSSEITRDKGYFDEFAMRLETNHKSLHPPSWYQSAGGPPGGISLTP